MAGTHSSLEARRRRLSRRVATVVPLLAAIAAGGACRSGAGDPRPASPTPAGRETTTTTGAPVATAAPVDPVARRTAELQSIVEGFAASHTVPFSVVVIDVPTGAHAQQLAGRVVLSASLYKLFVARELLARIAGGTLDRNAPAGDGNHHRVGECLRLMIVVSDNACGQAGLRMVGGAALDARLHADGYPGTFLASPQRTTADDVARFLSRARDASLLGAGREPYARELYDLLKAQQVNDRFPSALPAGTLIAHKTGDRLHWAHDAGVITTARGDVVLVALSGPWPAPCCDADKPGPAEAAAFRALGDLARQVFTALDRA